MAISEAASAQQADCGKDENRLTQTQNHSNHLSPGVAETGGNTTAGVKQFIIKHGDFTPTPEAVLVFQDGLTVPIYKPLEGFESLFEARNLISLTYSSSSKSSGRHPIQAVSSQILGEPQNAIKKSRRKTQALQQSGVPKRRKPVAHKQGPLDPNSIKRARHVAQSLAANDKAVPDDNGLEYVKPAVEEVIEESNTFYIGHIDALKKFLAHRFEELTMKPLRGIVIHWIKVIEPQRFTIYGGYHGNKPCEAQTPPWWPESVPYSDPAHLEKDHLTTLAVEMILVHRESDAIKRKKYPWISKLRHTANFIVGSMQDDKFSSAKNAPYSQKMKKRAQEQILPGLFDVSEDYEDHIIQNKFFEGSGNEDPGHGKNHSWKPILKPDRPQHCKRKISHEASRDETSRDDTTTKLTGSLQDIPQATPSFRPVATNILPEARAMPNSVAADHSPGETRKIDTFSTHGPDTPMIAHDDYQIPHTPVTTESSVGYSFHGLHSEVEPLETEQHGGTLPIYSGIQPFYCMETQAHVSGHVCQPIDRYLHQQPEPVPYISPYGQSVFDNMPVSFSKSHTDEVMSLSDDSWNSYGVSHDYLTNHRAAIDY